MPTPILFWVKSGSAPDVYARLASLRYSMGRMPVLFEQLREAVGGGATDRLGDLPHGEIRADEQAFRLTHLTERNRPSIIFAGSR